MKMASIKNLILADLTASGLKHVPSNYIRPMSDRPNLDDFQLSDDSISLIDLQHLHGPNHGLLIDSIGKACLRDGFFQGFFLSVKNHGMSEEMINSIMNTARDFFNLPESERLKSYSDDPTKTTRLSTSFNVKAEKVTNWRDFLRLHCYPLEDYIHEWHSNPPQFSEGVRNGINSNPFMISENLQSRDMILKKNGD
ncbi:protein DMR6-LIKE OXYGENASE 1-like isoform X1 [Euphorbia lathyris]|uniref:protein DMR6-LIKE OXYGENASE 1-like isoform X1 n=1 Tax=Euphorbia lathyris TaxID=212925 RepID=UPI00331366D1